LFVLVDAHRAPLLLLLLRSSPCFRFLPFLSNFNRRSGVGRLCGRKPDDDDFPVRSYQSARNGIDFPFFSSAPPSSSGPLLCHFLLFFYNPCWRVWFLLSHPARSRPDRSRHMLSDPPDLNPLDLARMLFTVQAIFFSV